jgi:hypothetical protein
VSEHYPRIRIDAGYGHTVAREGLSFTFYMRRAHPEIVQPVMRVLETYQHAINPRSLGCYVDQEGEYQPLDDAGWALIRRKLIERRWPIIHLCDAPDSEDMYRFEYHGKDLEDRSRHDTQDATCAVSFWLPTEFLEEHGPGRVRALALELAAPLPFCSGHGGLSFNGELDLLDVPQTVASYCWRHPGIDVPNAHHHSWKVGTRVRGPHWLTFLGQPVLGELGGAAALRSRLRSSATTVQELNGDRVMVTLGEWPEAGDADRGDTLPAFRELARVLEPYLFHEPHGLMLSFSPEETRRWERRFLDGESP